MRKRNKKWKKKETCAITSHRRREVDRLRVSGSGSGKHQKPCCCRWVGEGVPLPPREGVVLQVPQGGLVPFPRKRKMCWVEAERGPGSLGPGGRYSSY